MGLFSFTSGKAVDAFARQLGQDFHTACQRPDRKTAREKAFDKKADQVLVSIYARAKAFRTEKKLGVLNRARFAKSFQDELVSLGYGAELVTRITSALVTEALAA